MAAKSLAEDLIIEILSRVPVKSLCRFNCVSWRYLISYSEHRRKLPQTLVGFFSSSTNVERFPESALHFTNVSGSRRRRPRIYPSFAFLPKHRRLVLLDCCNGLLLCRWYDVSTRGNVFRYVVCNPATEKWVSLPDSRQAGKVATARLGFDPAVSPHFHVFELVEVEDDQCERVFVRNRNMDP